MLLVSPTVLASTMSEGEPHPPPYNPEKSGSNDIAKIRSAIAKNKAIKEEQHVDKARSIYETVCRDMASQARDKYEIDQNERQQTTDEHIFTVFKRNGFEIEYGHNGHKSTILVRLPVE